ncbi:MAG: prepilin peptidase [Candidatus Adiutrix sp.]|jgi:leader peptidase (prepilin peptidase)/N-methyltransferase|nr:prepilin peptidase [Candidatus Adiutrix sp.]
MEYASAASWAVYFLVLIFGLSVGSFLNVVIYRLPRDGLSVKKPERSFCPVCGQPIRWHDNIPLLSWLLLGARCRSCRKPISCRYPLVELLSGLLALYVFHCFGPSVSFLLYFYFLLCLVAIALIDLELMIIPVHLMYPTTALGLLGAALYPSLDLAGPWLWAAVDPQFGPRAASLAGSAAGMVLGWLVLTAVSVGYKLVRGHVGLGDGDPPLLAMIGAWLGWRAVPLVILWSTLIGLFSVAVMIILARGRRPEGGWAMKPLPFGPFLVLGAFLYLFFGPAFLDWYWSLAAY